MKFKALLISLAIPLSVTAQLVNQEVLLNSGLDYGKEEEKWLIMDTELVDSTNLEFHEIYYPHALTINQFNQVAIMAWDDRAIYIFDEGNFDNPLRLKSRKGRGPREYDIPFDMYFFEKELWVSDISSRKLEAWNIEKNDVVRTHVFRNVFIKPDQIAICKDEDKSDLSLYVLSTQYGYKDKKNEGILHKFKVNGDSYEQNYSSQKLIKPEERYGYVITGDVACDNKGNLFYSGDFTGTIRKYSSGGEIEYFRIAINIDISQPLFFEKDENMTVYNPDAPRINGDVFIVNEKIYVGRSRSIDRYIYGLDAYDPKSGRYVYSIKFPTPAKEYAITKDKLVIVEYRDDEAFDLKIYDYSLTGQ